MTPLSAWVEGARPRTLPAAVAPVLAGSAFAWFEGGFAPLLAGACLVVSLALQVGVNYANDYSDGIRGTDAERVGPLRLVGSGTATPAAVKAAAFGCFGVAAVAGLAIVVLTGFWGLLLVGLAAILAAWFYTGGRNPYGYQGWGEVFVFVFFGLVAVGGTTYVQLGRVTPASWWAAVAIGCLACSILVANNLRDLAGDRLVGKRTLATRLGDAGTRRFYVALNALALASMVGVALTSSWWALLALASAALLIAPTRAVLGGESGRGLIVVLKSTGLAELVCSAGLFLGLVIAG